MVDLTATPYSRSRVTTLSLPDALAHLRALLHEHGWDVVFERDLGAPVDRVYVVFGVLPPALWSEALPFEDLLGLLLPWHVLVTEDLGKVLVAVVETHALFALTNNGMLADIATRADAHLTLLLESFPEAIHG